MAILPGYESGNRGLSRDVPGFDLELNGGEMITSDDMKDQGLKLQLVALVLSIIRQS